MPRGQRRNLDNQIKAVTEQMDKYQSKVDELQNELNALMQEKKNMEVDTLYSFISSSNLSIEDAMEILETQLRQDENIA